ncbi:MAG: alkane 1-monooxygenase [Flavobacteriales bacterium]
MKYLLAFLLPLTTWISFHCENWVVFLPVIFGFVIVPITDQMLGPDKTNFSAEKVERMKEHVAFDLMLYAAVLVHLFLIGYFLTQMKLVHETGYVLVGHILAMGMMCGVFGINVAHELGHRPDRFNQTLSKIMLATTGYIHFFIEHNKGHHRNVGTPEDAATARKNESLYRFWLRSISGTYLSAWKIAAKERQRKNQSWWLDEMLRLQMMQWGIFLFIGLWYGWLIMIYMCLAAVFGIILLETVNYIEHYGLERKKVSDFRYEDVHPMHSWNSDFVLGRIVLFELTRHSDHHTTPHKHYQVLNTTSDASELPAGYPAMMMLSMIPPLWFRVMNPRL